jgi:mRNA interferase HigB
VHVISRKALNEFADCHSDSRDPLFAWFRVMSRSTFSNMAELRKAFNSVDLVEGFFVFNIGGNHFRLVAAIHFNTGRVYVRHVLTHAEYDKGGWKK